MRAPRADRQRLRGERGAGSKPLRAFNAYGLSKGLTAAAAESYADRERFTFEKFVIPNPFGPYEEPRFTSYLMKTWLAGETARVQTPRYVRDNIHVSLLAKAYAAFVGANPSRELCDVSTRAAMRKAKRPLPGVCVTGPPRALASHAGSTLARRANFPSRRCALTPISSMEGLSGGTKRKRGMNSYNIIVSEASTQSDPTNTGRWCRRSQVVLARLRAAYTKLRSVRPAFGLVEGTSIGIYDVYGLQICIGASNVEAQCDIYVVDNEPNPTFLRVDIEPLVRAIRCKPPAVVRVEEGGTVVCFAKRLDFVRLGRSLRERRLAVNRGIHQDGSTLRVGRQRVQCSRRQFLRSRTRAAPEPGLGYQRWRMGIRRDQYSQLGNLSMRPAERR